MNVLTQTWRQLVRRRLWPVALLLVAALVAVPVVLAKPATPPSTPAPAAAAAPAATPAQSFVTLASDDAPTKRRRVLGAPKDPFEPAPLPKVKHHKKAKAATATPTPTATPSGSSSGSGSSSAAGTGGALPVAPAAPVATATPAPVVHVPANSADVRFGTVGGELAKSNLQRDDTLPASSPLIVFMGLHKGGKVAEFMLTGDVKAEGDGTCSPSTQSCETLLLHKGETEFLTFSGTGHDGQYQLDVKDLHPGS